MILKPELNAKSKITAVSCNIKMEVCIINWRLEEIRKTDMKTRTILKIYKMHHPKADIDRLYLKKEGGGRGLLQIKATYKAEVINTAEYLYTKYEEHQFIIVVKSHSSKCRRIKPVK
jgi:hypothetical protein